MTDHIPAQPINLDDAVAGITAEMRTQLRNLMHAFGIPYTEHTAAAPAPHHLDAMREAWAEGYDDGHANGRRKYDGDPGNPYAKLLDDRRQFVREQVENGYGALVTDDDEFVLGDDNAEWFDAVLDAHDEWLTLASKSCVKPEHQQHTRAEARVSELDGVLHRIADIANLKPGRVPVEDGLDDVRTVLERAGYGRQPGGWVPPYSADEALGKIWRVLTEGTLDRDDQRLNGVRDILAEMGYHEHVHTRLATADEQRPPYTSPICGAVHVGHNTEIGYSCTLNADHVGDHQEYAGATWSDADGDLPAALCGDPLTIGVVTYACNQLAGHEGRHLDGAYGIAWAQHADGSVSSWRSL
ncbi:hypothetical protein SEA_SCHOTTB_58 [Gordonia Phage SchottB]|nr:hypothetical protein SEA_SCHOTTB_58 [Gordonia Phage SchottB]